MAAGVRRRIPGYHRRLRILGPGGESGLNRQSAEREMVDFVKAIAHYARVTKGKPGFAVFPQNGEGLSAHADYVPDCDRHRQGGHLV